LGLSSADRLEAEPVFGSIAAEWSTVVARPVGPKRTKTSARGRKHRPTPEQAGAIDLFKKGGSLTINAYAGTGKTSTLEMLAHSTGRRGHYLAFNRDIVGNARHRFPGTVHCSTTHGLAYKALARHFEGGSDKLTGRINVNELADLLDLKNWRVDQDHALPPRSQAFLILDTLRRFSISADPEPTGVHVPRHGALTTASGATLRAVKDFAVRGAQHVWERMKDRRDPIPLGHDGYLKLWALSQPQIPADFILMDEAQDTNPVVLDVLRQQATQVVYVGDRYQQIYEWRGATNAMEAIETDDSTFLTHSFRFGTAIAEGATGLLRLMGESRPLQGSPALKSRIGPTKPKAILARTNAAAITAVIEALDAGHRPHLIGGSGELIQMLRGVSDLKDGRASTVPDFFGFADWEQVAEFARSDEGEHLLTFAKLVETRGERQLMWALGRTACAADSNLVVSTAHKAKGREWPRVRLMDDFVRTSPKGQDRVGSKHPYDLSDLRLLYVALTRARQAVELPLPLLALMEQSSIEASMGPRSHARMPKVPIHAPCDENGVQDSRPPRHGQSTSPKLSKQKPTRMPGRAADPASRRSQLAALQRGRPRRKGILGWLLG
jgi:hypothetical protein